MKTAEEIREINWEEYRKRHPFIKIRRYSDISGWSINEIPHGTLNAYTNGRCRCLECKNAWRLYYDNVVKPRRAAIKDQMVKLGQRPPVKRRGEYKKGKEQ